MTSGVVPVVAVIALIALALPARAGEITEALVPLPTSVKVLPGHAQIDAKVEVTVDAGCANVGTEGYRLSWTGDGCRLIARTDRGVFYGKQTIRQLRSVPGLPCCEISDSPRMAMRAVMFDLARCKEKHEYYYAMIDQLARWKINTVFLHLTDDSGCSLEIRKHPALATRYAFSQDEMKDLIRYAGERHIELIPEIESWGHASYITRLPEFAGLAEARPSTLCTSNPKTWEVLRDIYTEVSALFPSRYMHAGCDESDFGKCELCKAKMADGPGALVGEHLKRVCELVKAAGKTPIIWGDVLQLNRSAADAVPKDTIICYWNYKAEVGQDPARFFREKGFTVLGCPALVWGGRMILPAADSLDNIRSFTGVVLNSDCMGMETTVWVPQRYIPDTLYFGLAYAAETSWSGEARDRLDFAGAFCRTYYGFEATTELAHTLWNVHGLSMQPGSIFTNLWNYRGQVAKLSTNELLRYSIAGRDRAAALANSLRRYRKQVTNHEAEYDALVLAADTAKHLGDRAVGANRLTGQLTSAAALAQKGDTKAATERLVEADGLLQKLIANESAIAKRLDAAWDRWRYADDPVKAGSGQNLVGSFIGADQYMKLIQSRLATAQADATADKPIDLDAILEEPKEQ